MSVACIEEGSRMTVMTWALDEQLKLDGASVMLPDLEFMLIKTITATIAARAMPPTANILGVTLRPAAVGLAAPSGAGPGALG